MFSKLPELCCVHFLKDDIEIISAKIHSCDIYKKKTEQDIDGKIFVIKFFKVVLIT